MRSPLIQLGVLAAATSASASPLLDAATDAPPEAPPYSYDLNFILKSNLTIRTNAEFSYRYFEALSSRVTLLFETFEFKDEVEGFAGSTRNEFTKELMLDAYALEYTLAPTDGLLVTLGLSFDLFFQETAETGSFFFGESQEYDNRYAALFLSPKASAQTRLRRGRFALEHRIEAIPAYYYLFDQDISILPLVPSGVEHNAYRDWGTPFVKNDLRLAFWYVELQGIHEYQDINFTLLHLMPASGGSYAFTPVQSSYFISNFLFMVFGRLPVLPTLDFLLGTGIKLEKTHDRERDVSVVNRHQWLLTLKVANPLFD